MSDDSEEPLTCKECGTMVTIECGYEVPSHGLCYPCASTLLAEIMTRRLPDSERHLMPSFHKTVRARANLNGIWVQAPWMGCVRTELARQFASEILRVCDEADAQDDSKRDRPQRRR